MTRKYIKQACLMDGMMLNPFNSQNKNNEKNDCSLPKSYTNFKYDILQRNELYWTIAHHPNKYLSLAMFDPNSPILKAYTNKLSLMVINASRLAFTVAAYTLYDNDENNNIPSPSDQALNFYLKYEISQINLQTSANLRFSQFLHSLKTSGSEDYIFSLARTLQMNVDLIKTKNYLFRYTLSDCTERAKDSFNGILTALYINNNWNVFVSKTYKIHYLKRKCLK